ncbi:hypothetical protein Sango_0484600 [Sesamum angolense]|uniref:Uncharacterized protein n=1 Tax=Sesamum angolense TaxID=2727404 RepID=A0AAE1XCL5_9LAMI|nr:hypothetical protein Sango_0484600 [Sesamum angolense]
MSSGKEEDAAPRRRLSCTKYFDALWFCYSPVHQMQQYYRLGALDNCSESGVQFMIVWLSKRKELLKLRRFYRVVREIRASYMVFPVTNGSESSLAKPLWTFG